MFCNDDNSVAYLINEHKVEKRQLLLRGLEREIRRDDRLMDRMINQEFRDERIMNNQLRRDERFMRDTMIPFGGGLYNDPFIQPIGGFYY
ncbi:hypothetical protein T4D_1520 [Trichinella pseudospiralis]|uniref:Uncharacterized protein n=1 Tax=Trichinella pseudospiralis TaxID=6337 RepID=A0A0V1FW22_TRIPS|nr:hypothetical protein T4D_1520 [Trichinella pseudospiralis]